MCWRRRKWRYWGSRQALFWRILISLAAQERLFLLNKNVMPESNILNCIRVINMQHDFSYNKARSLLVFIKRPAERERKRVSIRFFRKWISHKFMHFPRLYLGRNTRPYYTIPRYNMDPNERKRNPFIHRLRRRTAVCVWFSLSLWYSAESWYYLLQLSTRWCVYLQDKLLALEDSYSVLQIKHTQSNFAKRWCAQLVHFTRECNV